MTVKNATPITVAAMTGKLVESGKNSSSINKDSKNRNTIGLKQNLAKLDQDANAHHHHFLQAGPHGNVLLAVVVVVADAVIADDAAVAAVVVAAVAVVAAVTVAILK